MSIIPIYELLHYMNLARTDPQTFSQYIKKEYDSFINQYSLPLKQSCNYKTKEGKSAWKEAYQFLQNCKPIPPILLNEGLNLAAYDHAMDMKNNNFFGHQSSNGMSFSDRIERRCGENFGNTAESIGSQFDIFGRNHALQTVIGLIIDDGSPSRSHRNSIFSNIYKYCGIYSVKMGDRIYSCINFHSQNLKVVDHSINPLTGKYIKKQGLEKHSKLENPSNDNFKDLRKSWKEQFDEIKTKTKFQNNDYDKEWNDMKSKVKVQDVDYDRDWNDMKGKIKLHNDDYGKVWDKNELSKKEERYVTSKSSSTKTSTVNGKTKKVTTVKLQYSDGSMQEEVTEQTY